MNTQDVKAEHDRLFSLVRSTAMPLGQRLSLMAQGCRLRAQMSAEKGDQKSWTEHMRVASSFAHQADLRGY